VALIRVFMPTHRRPATLRRAIQSLISQAFEDWICEVHNDAPDDEEPAVILAEFADRRIELHRHKTNWGAVATLNHAYAGGSEPYATILEDDNWWEPGFLARLLETLEKNRSSNLAWSNMRIWQQLENESWRDTGTTVWPTTKSNECETLEFPTLLQLTDSLHSHGAMLFRRRIAMCALVPPQTPLAIIEAVRERAIAGQVNLIREPLANFSVTLDTARAKDLQSWLDGQLLLASTFLQRVVVSRQAYAKLWRVRRSTSPRSTNLLLLLALLGVQPKFLLRDAQLRDWFYLVRSIVRHPIVHARCINFRRRNRELWDYLVSQTDARMRAAESNGFEALDDNSFALKSEASAAR
jgi:glycosyltransferase involved in cell wall biosynthesis